MSSETPNPHRGEADIGEVVYELGLAALGVPHHHEGDGPGVHVVTGAGPGSTHPPSYHSYSQLSSPA